jgi:SAM-dependent methyltransferase
MAESSFDAYASTYRSEVDRSIAFAGVDHADMTARKADHLLSLCASLLGPADQQRVLDVGCGVGLTDTFLLDRVGALTGIDVSGESVAMAAAANPGASYRTFDGGAFPLEDESFDLAFAICVLHHVEPQDRASFAAELRRVVRPGGVVAIFDHNPWNPLTQLAVRRCALDATAVLSRCGPTTRLLRDAGLDIERRAYILFTRSARWSAGADRVLARCPAGAQYYVAARRPPGH